MDNETKNEVSVQPNNQSSPSSTVISSVSSESGAMPMPGQKPLFQEKPKRTSKLISASLIVVVSGFVACIGLMMFAFSDVRHPQDYLVLIGLALQFVFAIALYNGKRWGLIGYSVFLLALYITIFIFYADQLDVARKTALGISPILLPVAYLWAVKRDYFS